MAVSFRKNTAEVSVEERTIRLEERVDRLQVDMTDVKAHIQRVDSKVDALRDRFELLHAAMLDRFAAADRRMSEIAAGLAVLTNRVDNLTTELRANSKALLDAAESMFDRKFFRATGIIFGGVPIILATLTLLEDELSTMQILAACSGITTVIWLIALVATRRRPAKA